MTLASLRIWISVQFRVSGAAPRPALGFALDPSAGDVSAVSTRGVSAVSPRGVSAGSARGAATGSAGGDLTSVCGGSEGLLLSVSNTFLSDTDKRKSPHPTRPGGPPAISAGGSVTSSIWQ